MSTCLVRAPKDTWIRTDQGRFRPKMAAMELPIPNTKNIGTEKHKRKNDITNANMYIKRPSLFPVLDQQLLERSVREKTMLIL